MKNEPLPLQSSTKKGELAFKGGGGETLVVWERKIYILKSAVHIINHDIPYNYVLNYIKL